MIKSIVAAALMIAAGAYYFFLYPPVVQKRATDAALIRFSDTIVTKDRAKIGAALSRLIADEAQIRLEVQFLSITAPDSPAVVQDFTKASFLTFMDNTLYPLTDYGYYSHLEHFTLSDDRTSAVVMVTSKAWADGTSMYGGVSVAMRYSSDTSCDGAVRFSPQPEFTQLTCRMQFRSVPKPGEIDKMHNLDSLKDFLQQQ